MVLCDDNSVHLWQIELPASVETDGENSPAESESITKFKLIKSNNTFVHVEEEEGEHSASTSARSGATDRNQITALHWNPATQRILVGTQNGKVFSIVAETFELETSKTILPETILFSVPEEHRKGSLGEIEQLAAQPHAPHHLLIGYNRGTLVLWSLVKARVERVFLANQRLESLAWLPCGHRFLSAHNDGSYITWNVTDEPDHPSEPANTVYGPFPCKPIQKVYGNFSEKADEDFVIFTGGMPRQTHSDRHTVSIIKGSKDSPRHQAFELTSKVVDFAVVGRPDSNQPIALIVLAEEELVAIDLEDPDWLQFRLPYLASVHLSPITCCHLHSGLGGELIQKLEQIGAEQMEGKFSSNPWPVNGGILGVQQFQKDNELLITGHEDGSVRLWNVTGVAMSVLCSLRTSKLFFSPDDDIAPIDGDEIAPDDEDDEWPPFRKVGVFDPYSDDPRLGIRKVLLCPKTCTLVVAGTAGQLIVYELKTEPKQTQLGFETMNLVGDCDGFVWKSHDKLQIRTGSINVETGFQPRSMLQLSPPAAISALALNSDWGLVSVGTGHGFGVFDYVNNKIVCVKCTLNPADMGNYGSRDALITRRKSFKKSLRESFRRLRRGKSQRQTKKAAEKTVSPTSPSGTRSKGIEASFYDAKPVERQIEAKGEDGLGSVVRYLYFTKAPISSSNQPVPSLWAGTNAGRVFIYVITLPVEKPTVAEKPTPVEPEASSATDNIPDESNQKGEQSTQTEVEVAEQVKTEQPEETTKVETCCILAKEIQLKHHAPVIFIHTVDASGRPINELAELHDKSHPPKVLICSEEQFKLFNLPTLKPFGKFKLTAHEGSKARRIHLSEFVSKSDSNYKEFCICTICNQGDVGVYSILDLKRQMSNDCTKREDIIGISSLVFADNGDGFYLNSPSEFSRFSLSAARVFRASCTMGGENMNRIVIVDKKSETSTTEPLTKTHETNVQTTSLEPEQEKPKEEKQPEKISEKDSHVAHNGDDVLQQVANLNTEMVDSKEASVKEVEDQLDMQVKQEPNDVQERNSSYQKEEGDVSKIQPKESAAVVQPVAEENSDQPEEIEPVVTSLAEHQLESHALNDEELMNEEELFEDSRADEDTVIDHIEPNGVESPAYKPKQNGDSHIQQSSNVNGKTFTNAVIEENGDGGEEEDTLEDKSLEVNEEIDSFHCNPIVNGSAAALKSV